MKLATFFVSSLASVAVSQASRLLASSYDGTVSSLTLTPGAGTGTGTGNGTGHLAVSSVSNHCGANPSWMMLDTPNDILYCLGEGMNTPNGTIATFRAKPDGSLAPLQQLKTVSGPVMAGLYTAQGKQFLAVGHYEGSAVTTYSITSHGLTRLQTFNFKLDKPGPNASRQDAAHAHGVYIDPTGRFVLVPDLGADLVRIFEITQTGHLSPVQPLETTPGLGPRHLAFWMPRGAAPGDDLYMYLVSELQNVVVGFKVGYTESSMSFSRIYQESVFGPGKTGREGSKAAEIVVSPQNTHIIISNRLDHTFGPNNDSFAIFSVSKDGTTFTKPSFQGLKPAYGLNPRQFQLAGPEDGHLVAAAMEDGRAVVITNWDTKKQAPGSLYAKLGFKGKATSVVWQS